MKTGMYQNCSETGKCNDCIPETVCSCIWECMYVCGWVDGGGNRAIRLLQQPWHVEASSMPRALSCVKWRDLIRSHRCTSARDVEAETKVGNGSSAFLWKQEVKALTVFLFHSHFKSSTVFYKA